MKVIVKGREVNIRDTMLEKAMRRFPARQYDDAWYERFLDKKTIGNLGSMSGEEISLRIEKGMTNEFDTLDDVRSAWQKKMSEQQKASYKTYFYNGRNISINANLISRYESKTGVYIDNVFINSVLKEAFTDNIFKEISKEELENSIEAILAAELEGKG